MPAFCFRRLLGAPFVTLLVAGVLAPASAWSQVEGDVVQGGFRLFDPDDPRGREGDVLSIGPLIVGGARARVSPPDEVERVCRQLLFALLGDERVKRSASRVRVSQKDHVVAFFVFSSCIGEDEVCLLGASEPVAVEGCSGSISVSTRKGISGKVKLSCKRGIPLTDSAFDMSGQEQAWATEAFPGIEEKYTLNFSDEAGEEVTNPDLATKIMNLDPDALDDVVGTYLADDGLPPCM